MKTKDEVLLELEENQASLLKYYKRQVTDLEQNIRRQKRLLNYVWNALPKDLLDRLVLDVNQYGTYSTIISISPADGLDINDLTIDVIEWFNNLDRFTWKKRFNENEGKFSYYATRNSYGVIGHDYKIRFSDAGNIDDCKVIKREKTVTVFETNCEDV